MFSRQTRTSSPSGAPSAEARKPSGPDRIRDPVSGFLVPREWIGRAKKMDPGELEAGIKTGRLILLSDGTILRRGYTTGTTAAAAAKAAVLTLRGGRIGGVLVPTPSGFSVWLPVTAENGRATAVKDAGDHPWDATRNIKIKARATPDSRVKITPGRGIGTITRDGLPLARGEPAINPAPRSQIEKAITEALKLTGQPGVEVTISIPQGEKVAEQTLNPKLGVEGGISILGTTGFVEPWNKHLLEEKLEEIKKHPRVVLTTGRTGTVHAKRLFPHHGIVMIGNNLDLTSRVPRDRVKEIIICGLPGLILKYGDPEILEGTGFNTVQEMVDKNPGHPRIDAALKKAAAQTGGARIVLLNRDGSLLRDTTSK